MKYCMPLSILDLIKFAIIVFGIIDIRGRLSHLCLVNTHVHALRDRQRPECTHS